MPSPFPGMDPYLEAHWGDVHTSLATYARDRPYRISVFRAAQPDRAEVYRVFLRGRLPTIKIPLRPTDADVTLDLHPLLDRCYDNGRYDRDIDYRAEPIPPLSGDDTIWADVLLKDKKRR